MSGAYWCPCEECSPPPPPAPGCALCVLAAEASRVTGRPDDQERRPVVTQLRGTLLCAVHLYELTVESSWSWSWWRRLFRE